MEQIGDKSDEELRQTRSQQVAKVRQLSEQIGDAKLSLPKAERRQLELQRDFVYETLRNIDAELKRRGREVRNA